MGDPTTPSADAPGPPRRRRSSIAEMFNPRTASSAPISSSPPSTAGPGGQGPQHRRALSQALGISGASPTQSSPYNAFAKQRRASISTSSGSGSPEFRNSFSDEPAVLEVDDSARATVNPPPSPSFARRLSFGAQALRDVRQGSNAGATSGGEGFNWSEALRDRTKRSPSFSASANPFASRTRAPSNTAIEPPKEMPKPVPIPAKMKKPDHLGERMLRGDFMMD